MAHSEFLIKNKKPIPSENRPLNYIRYVRFHHPPPEFASLYQESNTRQIYEHFLCHTQLRGEKAPACAKASSRQVKRYLSSFSFPRKSRIDNDP
jgi:hypothetical protein